MQQRCLSARPVLTRQHLYQAIMQGAAERVRPKMMTVVTIIAGLLPIMWGTGTGSEVKPLCVRAWTKSRSRASVFRADMRFPFSMGGGRWLECPGYPVRGVTDLRPGRQPAGAGLPPLPVWRSLLLCCFSASIAVARL